MENYKLQENLQSLKALALLHEEELRKFGVEVNDLPEDIKNMLKICAETQINTGLHEMDKLYLNEFYLQKRKEQVDNKLAASKLRAEIDDLKKQIQQETTECDILEKFVSRRVVSEDDSRTTISLLDTQIKSFESKLDEIGLPENLDIDELMKKIEILKFREVEGKN